MNRYQFPTPRAALGVVAVALTALTVGLWVIAPTTVQPAGPEALMLATADAITSEPAAAALGVTRIDPIQVTCVRHATLGTTLVRHVQALRSAHKQQS